MLDPESLQMHIEPGAARPDAHGIHAAHKRGQPHRVPGLWLGIARIVSFFLLFVAACYGLDWAIKTGIKRIPTSDIGAFNRAMLGQVNAQIVISGSSRALVHYNPQIIQQVTGRSAYNLGRNGSHVDMHLAVLKAYLARNTKPQMVIYNLDLHAFQPTKELYDPAQYLPFLDSPHIYAGLKNLDPGVWKWKYVPLYGYAVQDMRFTWMQGIKGLLGIVPREDRILGFHPRDMRWTGDFDNFKARNKQGFEVGVEARGIREVQELIHLCAAGGIPLIFAYSPEYLGAQELTLNRSAIFDQFRSLAEKNSIPLLDYSNSPICRDQNLFYNSQHLNRNGAELFSRTLADTVSKLLPAN